MPPKKPDPKSKGSATKNLAKAATAKKGGKAKKKKWSKGKVREKLNNLVGFDADTLKKFQKEVHTYKLITPSVVSDRMKVCGSLARAALKQMHAEGQITLISKHSSQMIYTRSATAVVDEPVEETGKKGKK